MSIRDELIYAGTSRWGLLEDEVSGIAFYVAKAFLEPSESLLNPDDQHRTFLLLVAEAL